QLITTYQHKNYFQDLFLLCKDIELSKVVLQPEETVDARWASEETLMQMIENGEFVYSVGQRFKAYKDILQ
ncbi:MAG: hypothetical protein J5546_00865, partial [Lachnospiraceae bacterium]|nr:hypothetical protein [Lachnospiraceae bacterium]